MESMNYESIYANICAYTSDDEEAANELLHIIKITLIESFDAIKNLNEKQDQGLISEISHKLRISFSLIGSNDLLDWAIILDESIALKTEMKIVEETFKVFLKSFEDLIVALQNDIHQ